MEQGLVRTNLGPDFLLQSPNIKVCTKKNLTQIKQILVQMIQDQIVNFKVPILKYVPKRICCGWSKA